MERHNPGRSDSNEGQNERSDRHAEKVKAVENICNYIKSNLTSDLSLENLGVKFGLSPSNLQKIFKEIMGVSPRKYTEECRIHILKKNLRSGEPLPGAIYKAGYNSQSWLYENSGTKLGMHPSSYRKGGEGAEISYQIASSDLGFLIVATTGVGICAISIGDDEKNLIESLRKEYPRATITRSDIAKESLDAVLSFFRGQVNNLPLDIDGTEFQKRVWNALLTIPYGETRSYNDVAVMIGRPGAYRAVANACGANPVPLLVPCHRVVRKDGSLGGYRLGLHRKRRLLEIEQRQSETKQAD